MDMEAICSLAQRLRSGGSRDVRCVVLVDSMLAVAAASKRRTNARRLNCVLRCLGAHCLTAGLFPEYVWVPAWEWWKKLHSSDMLGALMPSS